MKVDEGYADRVLHEALTAAMGGLDPERVEAAITAAVDAITKQMQALEAKEYGAMPVSELARAVAHTTKAGDVLYRLAEFARGQPDSRPDNALRSHDVLKLLSDEQLKIVGSWLDAVEGVTDREARRPGSWRRSSPRTTLAPRGRGAHEAPGRCPAKREQAQGTHLTISTTICSRTATSASAGLREARHEQRRGRCWTQ